MLAQSKSMDLDNWDNCTLSTQNNGTINCMNNIDQPRLRLRLITKIGLNTTTHHHHPETFLRVLGFVGG